MGLVGALIGIPLGALMSVGIMYAYADVIGLISPVYTIFWIYPLIFSGMGIAISTLGAFFGAFKVVRIGPREALHSQYQAQDYSKKPILERFFDKVAYTRPILYRIPLRNLSRHRVRTLVTIVSLAASLLLVFACLTLFMGFTQPLEKNYEEYEKWDLKADLINPIPRELGSERISSDLFEGTDAELMIDDYVSIKDGEEMKFVRVQAFNGDSDLRNFHVIEGENDPDEGVLVGSILADDIGVGVGDEIELVLGNMSTRTEVKGITGELMDDSILMTMDQADVLLLANGTANSIILNKGGMNDDEIETILREEFSISSIMYTEDVVNGIESLLEGIIAMFFIFILFGVVAEVLFISTTVVLNILDRETEFISLRAIGTKQGKIRRMIVGESLILLAGGLIIGLPLGVVVTKQAMAFIVKDLMYYVLQVPLEVYFLTSLIAIISAMGAADISARWVAKANLAETIRDRLAR
jgi:putative ABC transport system permease protein